MIKVDAGVRNAAKMFAEAVLLAAARVRRRSAPQGVVVLAYHGVTPNGELPAGERALHISQSLLGAHLDEIGRRADVVPLDEISKAGASQRPRVVLTFDDAYKGAVTAGVEELSRRGMPAVVFACSERIGAGAFWWDELAQVYRGTLDPRLRAHCLIALGGREAAIRQDSSFKRAGGVPLPWYVLPATVSDLRGALRHPGVTIGSHSATHPNCTLLDDDSLERELSSSLRDLAATFGKVTPWLAYPYGMSDIRAEGFAAAAGYAGALTVGGAARLEWWKRPFDVARFNVPAALSRRGVALRLYGRPRP